MLTLARAKSWYTENDAVHGFDHIRRVVALCQRIGAAEKADMEIVLAAALLHDARGSHPAGEARADHHLTSAEFAARVLKEEGWAQERIQAVQHCIRAHRFRSGGEAPQTIEARVLFDADKLDVLGAIGVVRALGYALQNRQPAFSEPSETFLSDGKTEPGESYSAYHEYLYKLRGISAVLTTPSGRALAERRQQVLDSFFEELASESRVEY